MANKKLPCKECISYAICVNQHKVYCQILYDFICESKREGNELGFRNYRPDTAEEVFRVFNRYIVGSFFSRDQINLAKKHMFQDGISHETLLHAYRHDESSFAIHIKPQYREIWGRM